MKTKSTWLIFAFYLLLFLGAGVIFYWKYLDRFLSPNAQSSSDAALPSSTYLYYSQGSNLYRFDSATNPGLTEARPDAILSVGALTDFILAKTRLTGFYILKNVANQTEVWQINMSTKKTSQIAPLEKTDAFGYGDFSRLKINTDNTKLAFLGKKQNLSAIFVQRLSDNKLSKIGENLSLEISDYDWIDDKIVACSKNLVKNTCWQIDPADNAASQVMEAEIRQISANADRIVYLAKTNTTHLYRRESFTTEPSQIDNLTLPKEIIAFRLDDKGEGIAYVVKDGDKTDLYESTLIGTNRLQLTTDSATSDPLFSPDGEQIAYLKNDGLYLVTTSKTSKKILSFNAPADHLFVWR